jgi:hypothetical protein
MQVLVKDANTLPIANAQVTITRADPAVHIEGRTNASGELIEPLLSPSNNDYHPLATKSGYSTDYTSPATAQLPDPYNPDVSITEGLLTQATLYIDLLSTLNIQTRDAATGNAVASLPLKITGLRKILGDDAQDLPVYKYDQVHATNDQGNLALSNMEWDVYSFALANGAETLYSVAGFDYPNQAPDPVTSLAIDPASITTLTIYLDTFTANNLLFTIRNDTQQLQGEADIHLVKNSGGYDEHRTTTAFGQAFFRDLTAGSYTYAITKTGYVTQTGEIDVTGQLQPEITLVPQT